MGDDAGRHREPVRLRLPIELSEEHAGLSPRGAGLRIDVDALHRSQIDDDAAVADRVAGEAVTAAFDGEGEIGPPRERHGRAHIGGAGAPSDQGGTPVDGAVPDRPALVVGGVARPHEVPGEGGLQLA